jgi:hypothetical protein
MVLNKTSTCYVGNAREKKAFMHKKTEKVNSNMFFNGAAGFRDEQFINLTAAGKLSIFIDFT